MGCSTRYFRMILHGCIFQEFPTLDKDTCIFTNIFSIKLDLNWKISAFQALAHYNRTDSAAIVRSLSNAFENCDVYCNSLLSNRHQFSQQSSMYMYLALFSIANGSSSRKPSSRPKTEVSFTDHQSTATYMLSAINYLLYNAFHIVVQWGWARWTSRAGG